MSDYDPNKKVYNVQGERRSIIDLLHSFADPELEVDGIPRISDLHMKVGEPVRYRYDGDLETLEDGEVLTEDLIRELIFPLISETQRQNLLNDQACDIDSGYEWTDENINFRLNIFRDRDGMACVMRMLPKHIPEVDEIGFMNDKAWQDLVKLKQGLVLVTGVTGSGKSTTIASILDYINKSRKNRIITLEDPVEYVFRSEQALISQRELGRHVKTFPSGLRSALRENPDIIYIGEIRDTETAQLALTAAETGHLVLTTLHTKDVKGTFSRIVDMFPDSRSSEIAAQLSFSLAFAISQKLLARKTGHGRVPAFEVLRNNAGTANLIRSAKLHQIYGKMETGLNEGMNTLEQHLIHLVDEGTITKEEAIAHANDAAIVNRLD
ncbi:twitching motility protein [Coraliomargarita sinensis]|uniref:Twitching motility protein n=1 Tax=Coraliomargarita sinensis TaxID=2174842 RepID=A0A317ZML1_9BACT|nr:PilT/PilU family type 4a pilus ATPase [Coraliomargarita sinensis]PXA05188.1 twitching motility protein [Coraliomargarita sinensis]